jgi:hypothetical protein
VGEDRFVLPAPALITGFIVNSLLFFRLLAFIILFSLANNPDIAIVPSFVIGFDLTTGLPLVIATGVTDITSWAFTLWYFTGTAVICGVVGYLSRLLTRQNIVLSSKGD